jgi:hypothetical protein
LKAALVVAPSKDNRGYLNGVFLQSAGTVLNIVATDGCHLLQARMYKVPEDKEQWPAYLVQGVILDKPALARAIAFLAKDDDVKARGEVVLQYADNATTATLMDRSGDATFRIPVVEGNFPDYAKPIESAGAALVGGDISPINSMDGLAREYMKAGAQVATALDAKAVQVCCPTKAGNPWVIVYTGVPGVIHVVMPMRLEAAVGVKTLALIGSTNLKGSMAALKATITMKTKAMEEAEGDTAKSKHKAVIDSCRERMKAIEAALADNTPKLAAPTPEKPAKAEKPAKIAKVRKTKVPADAPKATH